MWKNLVFHVFIQNYKNLTVRVEIVSEAFE